MGKLFSKKRAEAEDRVEARFQTVVSLVKDLDKREFNRLKKGMELAWQGYQEVRQARTAVEKELADIEEPERFLEEELRDGRNN